MTERILTGWGRSQPAMSNLIAPGNLDRHRWDGTGQRGVLARGLGRSYGDAAQNAGGVTVDMTAAADRLQPTSGAEPGLVTVPAAMSLDALIRWAIPRGFFVPVTPGTRFVTVGGAIAADVHGKNHHRDGSFVAHVARMTIDTPSCGPVVATPGTDLFDATAGGMGLTGIITEAEIRLTPIETSSIMVTTTRADDLDSLLSVLAAADSEHRYTVAWLDPMVRGKSLGRGIVMAGDHATREQLESGKRRTVADPLAFDPSRGLTLPEVFPNRLLNPVTVSAFNTAWYLKAPRGRTGLQSITQFFHPLDGLQRWNRLYGARGFVQYQFVVPDEATDMLRHVVQMLSEARAPSPLTVLKRFGAQGPGLLSFPMAGWTLAMDLPASPRYAKMLDQFDELTVKAGGRGYFAKDARTRRCLVPLMYDRLEQWQGIRNRYDPEGLIVSDLDRRLNLSGRWP